MRTAVMSGVRAGRIRLLPEATINRIAAGEVIERPAAAARELVENALDAGATRISVAIEGGGIDRIEIADDGSGMDAAELALAVQRHATSKLADDTLVRIATLGFRGEALPSIGAAARLSITSRPQGADHAAGLSVEGGVVGEVAPAAGGIGTRVVVRDLFFATPARRKFLKSPRAEADATEAAIRRLALAAPHVAMRLENDGRVAFDLPAQDRAARIAALLGPEAAAALLPVHGERDGIVLTGFACAADRQPRHGGGAGAGGEWPPGDRPGAAHRRARRLSRRDRARPPCAGGAVPRSSARGSGRERASRQGGGAVPRAGCGARPRHRQPRPRAGRRRGRRGPQPSASIHRSATACNRAPHRASQPSAAPA